MEVVSFYGKVPLHKKQATHSQSHIAELCASRETYGFNVHGLQEPRHHSDSD